jgi:hypothetical protein
MLSKLNDNQLTLLANTCLEIHVQQILRDSLLLKELPESDGGLEVVFGMADVRATDLLMIRNLV